jgi:hypothetical protein
VAHACNASYSGGRGQEDHSSKPVWAKFERPCLEKNPSQKRAGGVAQGVGPEFKPQYQKKKKKRKEKFLQNAFLIKTQSGHFRITCFGETAFGFFV